MRRLTFFLRMWTAFNLRVLTGHAWRTLAVVLGIALGAAVFGSVRLAVKASLGSFQRSMDAVSGKADLSVVRPGGRVPEALISRLLGTPGVAAASPVLSTYVRTAEGPEDALFLMGIAPLLDRPFRVVGTSGRQADEPASTGPTRSAVFRLMAEPGTLLLGRRFMEERGLRAGDRIRLLAPGRTEDFLILGALDTGGLGAAHGGDIALCDIATFQEFTGTFGEVDRIDLILDHGPADTAVKQIKKSLAAGLSLERPSEARESGSLMIRSYQLNLSILSFVSLFVGMFLIYSLVSLHATARRKEIAILRSLGASSRLVFALFLADGAFFGIAGWVAALPLGSILVRRLLEQVSSTITLLFVRVRVEGLQLDAWEIALSLVVTVLVALVAACQPALRAMRVPPREALSGDRPGASQSTGRGIARSFVPGLACIALAWPLAGIPPIGGVPLPGYFATFCLFVGFSLLAPGFLNLSSSILAPIFGRTGGIPALLGARQVRDSGARSAVSVGALVTAVALFTALSIMIHSFRGTVAAWVGQSITGDLFIRAKMAEVNRYRDPVPPGVQKALLSLGPDVDILPYRRIYLRTDRGVPFQFEPADLDVFHRHAKLLMIRGDFDALLPELERGEGVIVSEVFSNQTGLRVGDRFRTRVSGADIDLPVLGTFRDYRTQGGVVYMAIAQYAERTGDRTWSGARIHLKAGPDPTGAAERRLLAAVLARIGKDASAVDLTLGTDLRKNVLRIFDETFAVTTALLVIALVIAALGIMTTLTVLVLDRLKQLNTLVAVGASRGQVRAMIFWEALLMVAGGEIIGSGCGFVLSNLLIYVINRQSFGWTFIYAVEWGTVLTSIPLVLGAALLAALPAMKVAFREPPATVLRE